MLPPSITDAFFAEFLKMAGAPPLKRTAADLLSSLAVRKGVDPKNLGAIKQVGYISQAGDRSRAAEIATRVRQHLRGATA